jgi:hypothetical protein
MTITAQQTRSLATSATTLSGVFLMILTITTLSGCSGGSGGAPIAPLGPVAASFVSSGTVATPDLVRLTGSSSGNIVTVEVVLGGATTNQDIYSYAFDLLLGDSTVASYVASSVSVGGSLATSGGQTTIALAAQNGSRVTVGVTKSGGGAGNGIGGQEEVIVRLDFRVLKRATTTLALEGSGSNTAAALDSNGAVIGSVQFDSTTVQISGV